MKVVSSVKLLGLQLDDKLNFNLHISNICKSAGNQLIELTRLKKLMNFEENRILIKSYFLAKFNYCPLVWMLFSVSSLKVHQVQVSYGKSLRTFAVNFGTVYHITLNLQKI